MCLFSSFLPRLALSLLGLWYLSFNLDFVLSGSGIVDFIRTGQSAQKRSTHQYLNANRILENIEYTKAKLFTFVGKDCLNIIRCSRNV